ncbi:MAG: oligogalacturonate lyase family protein [Pyrinomonadaceae bacterium]|nr:oligogalacturonate lyase family protein [Pyrinomonadaceae bacterium]
MQTLALAAASIVLCASMLLAMPQSDSDVGRRFPSEKRTIVDAQTGVTFTALTTSPANDAKIYQTHPQWTSDGKYIIFRSNRARGGVTQAFAVSEVTGEIIQLTDGPGAGTGSLNIARRSNKLYFLRGGRNEPARLIELNLDPLFADSEAGKMKEPAAYERVIGTLPNDVRESGGFTLDADEKTAYVGVTRLTPEQVQARQQSGLQGTGGAPARRPPGQPIPAVPGGIRSIDLETGAIKTVVDTAFTMGHVQANPWVPGEIIYCNETGGDAPQRMWFVRADGTDNHALYQETPEEWVTHEVVVDRDHVMFAIMGHLPRLRTKPTGIAVINLRNNEMKIVGQVEEGRGFWHCNGSADGRWAVGDNFNGNLYLIDRLSGETTLVTTDHKMRPDHAHPTFSPDGKRILIQSGLLSNGASLDLMVIPVPLSLQNRH